MDEETERAADAVTPRAAGLLVRARSTSRYLFLQDPRGVWNVPGGHIERLERPKQAAIREFVEETGFYGRLLVGSDAARIDDFWLYGATVVREFEPVLSDEHVDARWTTLRDMPRPHHPGLDLVIVERTA